MPAGYAHYRFGKHAMKTMPPEARQCVQRFRRMFDVGLQGPDIFFYYNPYWTTPVGKLGNLFHAMTGTDFFSSVCRAADSEAARAYLFGLLGRYCLDSICHGFVNQLDRAGEAEHVTLESEFDRFLLVLEGEPHPECYDLSGKIRLTRGECMCVSAFYPGASGRAVSRCVKGMARSIRFLAKPSREKLLRKLGFSFADHMIPAKDNEDHALYLRELKNLYGEALEKYPRMLERLLAHMENGTELGPDFEPKFD